MNELKQNGERLRRMRISKGWNASQAAKNLSISPQHLSRIENGKQAPSSSLLELMIDKYQIPLEDAQLLRGDIFEPASSSKTAESAPVRPVVEIPSMKLDPLKTPIQYTNALSVSSDSFGIVIDAGQRVVTSQDIQIVARIGFSLEHAVKIREALDEHIKKLQKNIKD